jgi:pseudaminic acid biosynthesis-associated methylase
MRKLTEQEEFWSGEFGDEYLVRNDGQELLASNLALFANALRHADYVGSVVEFGTNRGLNLRALHQLLPKARLSGVEINAAAHRAVAELGIADVWRGSIFDYEPAETSDLALAKGVLIHLDPGMLDHAYDKLYTASHRYVLLVEYYNPDPVEVTYRGHREKLFKRDFAGEMLDRFPDLALADYGFSYRRDPAFRGNDCTWFLLEKRAAR